MNRNDELLCHRIEWQFKSVGRCEKHDLKLLSKCPNREKKFKISALWEFEEFEGAVCDRCFLSFAEMRNCKHRKNLKKFGSKGKINSNVALT